MEFDLNQKIEDRKFEFQKSLQDFKHQLDIAYQKANKVYDNRLDRITKVYKLLTILQQKMEVMTSPLKFVTGNQEQDNIEEQERIKEATQSFNKFAEYYYQNKIFFPEETVDMLEQILKDFRGSHWDYTWAKRWQESKLGYEKAVNASNIIRENIPAALSKLEDNFRTLIGETNAKH